MRADGKPGYVTVAKSSLMSQSRLSRSRLKFKCVVEIACLCGRLQLVDALEVAMK